MKLLFLTVIPSPYQRQLFSSLADSREVDLAVFYYAASAHDRQWALPDLNPFEKVLEGRTITALGPSVHWNPDVMAQVDQAAPDLVIVSDYSALTAQVVMRHLMRRGQPYIFWGEVPGFSQRGAIGALIRRQLQAPLSGAEAIAGIGSVAVEAYKGLFPGKPVFNIPYFCDLEPFRRAGAISRRNKGTIDILFSGQLIERKGLDVLIYAFDQVARKHPNLRLLVLGEGPEKASYQAMVPTDLQNRVVFLGHKDPKDLPAVFASADIFCLPSRHDGWGVVVNEALGAGLPIVVSDTVGAGRDIVEKGKNGFTTPVGNVTALAEVLECLMDFRLRASMSSASRETSKAWDVSIGAERWLSTADKVLAISKKRN